MPFIPDPVVVDGFVDPAFAVRLLDGDPLWTVDGMAFNVRDTVGVEWTVDSIDGWDDGAPIRVGVEDRSRRDGAFDAESFKSARVITLTGGAVAPSPVGRKLAVDRFKAMLSDGTSLKPMVVDEFGDRRLVNVRLSGEPRTKRVGELAFTWQVTLIAPDPRKYSADLSTFDLTLPDNTTAGGVTVPLTVPFSVAAPVGATSERTVVNAGTVPTFPTVTIRGPVTDPVLENVTTGRRLRLKYNLAAGNSLVVDFDNEIVLLNGNTPVGALDVGSSFWSLVKGPNLIRYTAFAGAPGVPLSGSYRSAWN